MSRKSVQEVDRIGEIATFDPEVRSMTETSGRSFYALYRTKEDFRNYCDKVYRFACGGGICE
jgi:hypothetical protein